MTAGTCLPQSRDGATIVVARTGSIRVHVTIRPRRADDADVAAAVVAHVAEMDADDETPSEACHRLEVDGLLAPHVTLFGAHAPDGSLVGIAALAQQEDDPPAWAELKSMHVLAAHRGQGIARALLDHVVAEARTRGLGVLRLETARSLVAAVGLYRSAGFDERPAFGTYTPHPASLFMEQRLVDPAPTS